MVKKENSFLFEGRMRNFEKIILDYHLEMGRFSSLSDNLVKIMAYLSLYGKLTQGELKKLMNHSKSTISTGLSNLINIGQVRKEKIKGSREYEYFIALYSQKSIDFALGTMEKEIAFFKEKIRELDDNSMKNKNGYHLIFNRLKDALDVYEYYENILEILREPNKLIDLKFKREHKKTLTSEDFNYILLKIEPDLKRIENEVLDFFMYESTYSILTEFALKIYTLFLLRKILTQERIRELTGLSLGKVSQVVNVLIKNGLIIKIDKGKYRKNIPEELMRQTIYSIPSIKDSTFTSGIYCLEEMIKWEEKFNLIKSELIKNKEELENLRGYKQIIDFINSYFNLLPIYKRATSIFLKILI